MRPFGFEADEVGRSDARSALAADVWGARDGRLELADAGSCCVGRAGVERLVERLMINLPCTTRLSVDFLRSRVSI